MVLKSKVDFIWWLLWSGHRWKRAEGTVMFPWKKNFFDDETQLAYNLGLMFWKIFPIAYHAFRGYWQVEPLMSEGLVAWLTTELPETPTSQYSKMVQISKFSWWVLFFFLEKGQTWQWPQLQKRMKFLHMLLFWTIPWETLWIRQTGSHFYHSTSMLKNAP